MKNKVDLKVCGVCGDKALGYNFNAVTCESCKAFFRRNALIQKEFKCPFTNDCKITTVTRRFCQKCRLDKCFSIGMCKDLIMSEEDKAQKRQKIEENRAKKRNISVPRSNKKLKKEPVDADSQDSEVYSSSYNTDSDQDTSISEGYQPNNPNLVSVINYTNQPDGSKTINEDDSVTSTNSRLEPSSHNSLSFQNVLTQHLYNVASNSGTNFSQMDHALFSSFINNNTINFNDNIAKNKFIDSNNSTAVPIEKEVDVTKDVVREVQSLNPHSSKESPIESILSEAIKLEYEAYSTIAQGSSQSRQLNDAEKAKLNELVLANKALLTPIDEELSQIGNEFKNVAKSQMQAGSEHQPDSALLDVINLTAIGIRRLIKMAKKINAFKNMCQEDQVALLKGGCTEIMMMISARRYDPMKNTWKLPSLQESLNVNVNVLKLAKGNAYQELERFIRTFDPKWRTDENIILILCAIVLFTPDRPRVIHQDVVKLEQNSYYYLLRRYLESIYAGCEAKSVFLKLIQKIMELHKVNEEIINVLLEMCSSESKSDGNSTVYTFKPFSYERVNFSPDNGKIPHPRSGHRIGADSTNFYSFGGYNPLIRVEEYHYEDDSYIDSYPLFQELWKFNFASKKWTKFRNSPTLPKELVSNAVLLHRNILMIYGGTGSPFGTRCSNQLYVCNVNEEASAMHEVKTTGQLPLPQYGQAIVYHNDYLYAIGGTTGFDYTCDIHRLNLKTLTWEIVYLCNGTGDYEPPGRYRHEVGFDGKRIFILAGGTADTVYEFADIPAFDIDKRVWTNEKTIPAGAHGVPMARRCHGAAQIDHGNGIEVFITGGLDGDAIFQDLWRLNLRTLQWTFFETCFLPRPTYFHAVSVTPQGRLYVFGGIYIDEEVKRSNAVYSTWVCIPKLSELCWEAVLKYSPHVFEYSSDDLINLGLPRHFVQRLGENKVCKY